LHLVLALCDGTRRDARELSASLAVRYGVRIPTSAIEELLCALDDTCLLENASGQVARERALDAYRGAPHRAPAGAGLSYPDEPGELRALLDSYLDGLPPTSQAPGQNTARIRGLISPHIDYARGGATYAAVWHEAQRAAQAADLVLILGTDHVGSGGSFTPTRQHYTTPYGVLPTAVGLVDRLVDLLGGEACFAEELHHRTEHSIELAAVWLHHVRGGEPCELLPLLCGSFHPYVQAAKDARTDARLGLIVDALREVTAKRPTLVVAAADLAHVGPAFGGPPLDAPGRGRLRASDDALLSQICAGSADGFLGQIRQVQDRNNVCGVPPVYLALRLLEPVQGRLVSYDLFPADQRGASQVSVCGVTFYD
jgi:AmmeMemoRadiSam system protein B